MPQRHAWITGADRAARRALAASLAPDVAVDSDRRVRGPYTATGSVLRLVVPSLHASEPDLVARHAIEILAVAPELDALIGPAPGTLTSTASPQERTRRYSHLRTRRIAHGVIDLLRAAAERAPLTLACHDVEHADATDLEFLAVAARRLDPSRVRLVLSSATGELPDTGAGRALAAALDDTWHRLIADLPEPVPANPAEPTGSATAYVASDGTGDVGADWDAYRRIEVDPRRRLHDERADALTASGEFSLRLGAIPYHRGLGGGDDAQRRQAYVDAVEYCLDMGYYDAGLELCDTFLALFEPDPTSGPYYWVSTRKADFLVLLARPAGAEPIYHDLLSRSVNPILHMSMSYALAMLYTRIYGPELKDHRKALAHVHTAIVIAGQLPDPDERAFHSVFMNNGKALVEMHLGRLDESLRLVTEGAAHLDVALPPDKHHLHRSVLRHNGGQVYAALGRTDEAMADFDHVIAIDPYYPEYRFDRGNLLNRLGRHREALEDYQVAARLGPPFPELFYNTAELRARLGDEDGAIRDFRRVLDLEPDYLDARLGLARLLIERGEAKIAVEDVRAGLGYAPDEPRLHATLGLALLELDDLDGARASLDRALDLDPALPQALANRAVLAYQRGRYDDAVTDLSAALAVTPDDPDVLFNRGYAHQAAGRLDIAVADYTRALEHPDADRAAALYQRGRCLAGLGRVEEAREDLRAHLALGSSPHEPEIIALLLPA